MTHRPSRSRIVRYGWESPSGFDESAMDRLLYAARAAGVVTMHDAGRGRVVWFEGPPGPALRSVRDQAHAIASANSPVSALR